MTPRARNRGGALSRVRAALPRGRGRRAGRTRAGCARARRARAECAGACRARAGCGAGRCRNSTVWRVHDRGRRLARRRFRPGRFPLKGSFCMRSRNQSYGSPSRAGSSARLRVAPCRGSHRTACQGAGSPARTVAGRAHEPGRSPLSVPSSGRFTPPTRLRGHRCVGRRDLVGGRRGFLRRLPGVGDVLQQVGDVRLHPLRHPWLLPHRPQHGQHVLPDTRLLLLGERAMQPRDHVPLLLVGRLAVFDQQSDLDQVGERNRRGGGIGSGNCGTGSPASLTTAPSTAMPDWASSGR